MLNTSNVPGAHGPPELQGDNMQIKIIKGTVCDGKPCKVGDIVTALPETGRLLVNLRKAVAYTAPAKPATTPTTKKKAAKRGV